jgi:hypothetical protein
MSPPRSPRDGRYRQNCHQRQTQHEGAASRQTEQPKENEIFPNAEPDERRCERKHQQESGKDRNKGNQPDGKPWAPQTNHESFLPMRQFDRVGKS